MKTIKKTIAILTTVGVLSAPIVAQAILPLAAIAVMVEAAGGAVPFSISAAAHAAAIGLIVFTPSNGNQSSQDLANKPITVQIDPNTPLTTPPGWTDPKTPPNQNIPHETTQLYCATLLAGTASVGQRACGSYAEMESVKAQACAPYGGYPGGLYCADVHTNGYPLRIYDGSLTVNCPANYRDNGTSCDMENPEAVKKPPKGKDEIGREGNQFKRDPHQDISDNNPNVVLETPNRISYTDPASGEKVTISLNPTTGAATVTQTVPNRGNSTTSVQTTTVTSPASGSTVSGQSTETYPGVGDQTGTTPLPGGTGSGTGDCAHCATEATLSNLRDITNDIKTTLNGNEPMPELAGIGLGDRLDGVQDGVLTTMGNTMRDMVTNSGLLQAYQNHVLPMSPWAMATEGQSSSCEFSFNLMGKPYELSICQAQPFLHTAIAFVLFIFTAVGVFHLVTERPEGN